MDDLAAWLTQIWDGDEARLSDPTFCGPVWPTTIQLLARIAADRQILALATKTIADAPERGYDWESEYTRARAGAYERVVRLLALPYADRPGYQEAWKPE